MLIIKRSGEEVEFDKYKIVNALKKCKKEAEAKNYGVPTDDAIVTMATNIEDRCRDLGRAPNVEEVQDFVEEELIDNGYAAMMKAYKDYRTKRILYRKENTIDAEIESLLENKNEEIIQENSNKNPVVNSTARDYIAGIVSKDYARRKLFPEDVMRAHDDGLIHISDMDYISQHEHNCCLVNLKDMFDNGTVINTTMIETPKSFYTACNIASQIAAIVASNQYGLIQLPYQNDTNCHRRVVL